MRESILFSSIDKKTWFIDMSQKIYNITKLILLEMADQRKIKRLIRSEFCEISTGWLQCVYQYRGTMCAILNIIKYLLSHLSTCAPDRQTVLFHISIILIFESLPFSVGNKNKVRMSYCRKRIIVVLMLIHREHLDILTHLN